MEKNDVRNVLNRMKSMFEQKSSITANTNYQEYTNPGPMENVVYIPTHDGVGGVTASTIGGDVTTDNMDDVKYWKKKLFASIGIPGQYLGDTEDSTGFNGGTSLSLISSRYAKSIKRIQNAFIQTLTDAVNLMLIDKGLIEYIGKFQIRMQAPTTQEEKDRRDMASTSISNISSIMGLLGMIESPQTQLEIVKSMLANVVNNDEVVQLLQDEIDRLEAATGDELTGDSMNDSLGGGDLAGGDFGGGFDNPMGSDLGGGDEPEPVDLDSNEGGNEPEPVEGGAEESFYSREGSQKLNEKSLPSWNDLGVSYTNMK